MQGYGLYVDRSKTVALPNAGTFNVLQADPERALLMLSFPADAAVRSIIFKGGNANFQIPLSNTATVLAWTWRDYGTFMQREIEITTSGAGNTFYVGWLTYRRRD